MMAQRLRLHPPLPLAAGTLARRRLVSILHPGRLCAAGSSRSSTPDALAPQARLDPPRGWRAGLAWAPALGSHCGLRGRLRHRRAARSEPIVHALQVPRPTPLSSARASRLLRLSRVPSAWRPSRPRGPAPAVHACPRQRLGLGRSALVGDVAAAARREPRRRPDWSTDGSKHMGRARALTGEESALGHGRVTACLCSVTC